jgi:hypothetical protein
MVLNSARKANPSGGTLLRRTKSKPYRWTADPKRILEKLDRAWEALRAEIYNPVYGTLL